MEVFEVLLMIKLETWKVRRREIPPQNINTPNINHVDPQHEF